MTRIRYFEPNDGAFYYYLAKAETILKCIDLSKPIANVNDIIEVYNIIRYSKLDGCLLKSLYKTEIAYMHKQVNLFISNLDENLFSKIYRKIDISYIEDFWQLLDEYIKNLKFSDRFIKKVFNYKHFIIYEFVHCSKLVKKYNSELKKFLLKRPDTAELIINKYEEELDGEKEIFLPEFTSEEFDKIFINYIESNQPNLNYLQIIPFISAKEIKISDNVKLKAHKKAKEVADQLFAERQGLEYGSEVCFGNFKEDIKLEGSGLVTKYKYSSSWIENNLDFPTLLNNFIYLFYYVDKQMRFVNVSKLSEFGMMELTMGIHTKNEYRTGISFRIKQQTALMQMMAYSQELSRHSLCIEQLLDWVYSDYLRDEFKVTGFLTHILNSPVNYFEKCRILFPEIDGILKQFSIFQEYREVDHDLIEISSSSIPFEDVKSLVKKKYVYGNNKLATINFLLFSDQSEMSYLEDYKHYDNFYDLITHEKLKISQFQDYQKDRLKWLIDRKIIKRNKHRHIEFVDLRTVNLLYDLYLNEVISYYHYSLKSRTILDKLVRKGCCYFENTLFSKPEAKYLNYYLNNRSVSNGLSLRNRYGHGTQPRKDKEEVHKQNYLFMLYVIVLITIKINDDFCLFDENKKENR